MLARGALCRLAAEAPKQAAHDLPKLASLVQTARAGYTLPLRTLSHALQLQTRSYATEPTATVKKAVKTRAAAGKSVKKTTTAKKSAAKKPVKKAAPKKAKKKAAPKKKAVKKPRKVLTPEEKERAVISKLRKLALKEPVARRQITAFNVYLQDNAANQQKGAGLGEFSKGWKDITAAEHEKYNHLAAERNEARRAEYKAWVESHSPDVIRVANNARAALRRKLEGTRKNNKSPSHTQRIDDERAVKRPVTPWARFFGERAASTDFKSIALKEKTSLIAGEWRALGANEKQRYEDQYAADKQRYNREIAAQTKDYAT